VSILTKDTLVLATGLSLRWASNHSFDYVLYPVVLLWLGNNLGGVVLTVLATILNVLVIKAYDWSKVDWFWIEKIKHAGELKGHEGWKAHFFNFVQKNKILTFLILCLDDPVTVTLYFREGSYRYNGMSKRDWKIFLAANVVSNLYWIVGWVAIIGLFQKIWQLL
jgi:hypothetical protein